MDGRFRVAAVLARLLERAGVIKARHLRPTMDLAWPRIVTGFAIMSKMTSDLAMVGLAAGTNPAAGLAYAYAFWELGQYIGLGLTGGTISLVSQNVGGDENERAALVVTQSVVLSIAITAVIGGAFVLFARPLIAIIGSNPETVRAGAVYLPIVAPALLFEYLNLVASRTYAGVDDTYTPMVIRAGGAAANVVFSGLFIFGLGMGVAGAALGTTLSTILVTVALGWGMFGRHYHVLGMSPSPVSISLRGRWLDRELGLHLLEISIPLMARRVTEAIIAFPLLWIASAFGPAIVTSLEVGRRIRLLLNSLRWGLSIASSTLVGQHLGANDEAEAELYGASIIRLSAVLYVGAAVPVILLAPQIASLFGVGPDELHWATAFVQIGAISAIGLGIDGAATGALQGAGDTRLPFLSSIVGRYVFALPLAFLGLVTPLGVVGLYLALLFETIVPGGINTWLFHRGRWKALSRKYRPSTGPTQQQ